MGAIRRSFQKNVLLVKPKLGSTKKVTTDIPDEGWRYGVCNEYDEEGVREVLVHEENVPDLERQRGPDILSMNKLAAIWHVPKACQQRAFRKKNLVRLHISRRVGKSPSTKLPSEIDPQYIYGRPGEQDEDMWKVMQHGYANEWMKMNLDHKHKFFQPYKAEKLKYSAIIKLRPTETTATACSVNRRRLSMVVECAQSLTTQHAEFAAPWDSLAELRTTQHAESVTVQYKHQHVTVEYVKICSPTVQ
ncbi:hypothetical protein GOP47_0011276 [Adiantum capillus-veneris]|uniref:Uncharacterized protein n=1 Tax=Adiantum capillus-veneris TaxID=13818 RepID=A0A9D4UTX5_ADICA|nr:hypothetical protein GOP47_0011276 [Adiantum capillus-veneris]